MNRRRNGEIRSALADDVDVEFELGMECELLIAPKSAHRSTPGVDPGEAPRAAASFNHSLQRTRPSRPALQSSIQPAGSLSFFR